MLGLLMKGDEPSKVNEFLANLLRQEMDKSGLDLSVDAGDINIATEIPDQDFEDGHCKYKFHAHDLRANGAIRKSSKITASLDIFADNGPSVFLESKLDTTLAMAGNLRGSLHKKILGKCTKLARKTVGLQIESDGTVAVGISLKASEFELKSASWKSYELSFVFGLEIKGRVLSWDIASVQASQCNIKLFGIKVLSFCSWLEKRIENEANKYIKTAVKIQAPKLVQKLESKLRTKVGERVTIKFSLPWF